MFLSIQKSTAELLLLSNSFRDEFVLILFALLVAIRLAYLQISVASPESYKSFFSDVITGYVLLYLTPILIEGLFPLPAELFEALSVKPLTVDITKAPHLVEAGSSLDFASFEGILTYIFHGLWIIVFYFSYYVWLLIYSLSIVLYSLIILLSTAVGSRTILKIYFTLLLALLLFPIAWVAFDKMLEIIMPEDGVARAAGVITAYIGKAFMILMAVTKGIKSDLIGSIAGAAQDTFSATKMASNTGFGIAKQGSFKAAQTGIKSYNYLSGATALAERNKREFGWNEPAPRAPMVNLAKKIGKIGSAAALNVKKSLSDYAPSKNEDSLSAKESSISFKGEKKKMPLSYIEKSNGLTTSKSSDMSSNGNKTKPNIATSDNKKEDPLNKKEVLSKKVNSNDSANTKFSAHNKENYNFDEQNPPPMTIAEEHRYEAMVYKNEYGDTAEWNDVPLHEFSPSELKKLNKKGKEI